MTGTIGWVELREKFRGALVGAAVGDALGARFEGMASVGQADLGRLTEEPGPLRYTDDTHMTLGMAESLVERKGFDGHHMAGLFARNFKAEPWRGYGPGPPQVFHLLGQGEPWDEASRGLFGGRGSFGNGGAMRVAPAALFAFDDMEAVESLSRKTALITHSHELGIEGAALQACAIALALQRSVATGGIDPAAFVNELRAYVRAPEYLKKLERVGQLLALGGPSHRGEVVAQLGNGIEALHAFQHPPLRRHALVTLGFRFEVSRLTLGSIPKLFPAKQGIQRRISRHTGNLGVAAFYCIQSNCPRVPQFFVSIG